LYDYKLLLLLMSISLLNILGIFHYLLNYYGLKWFIKLFKCFCELSHNNSKSIQTSSKHNFSQWRWSESFNTAVDEAKNMGTDLNVYFMIKSMHAVINKIFDKRGVNNTSLHNISFRFRLLVLTNVFHLLPNFCSEMFSLIFPCNTCTFLVEDRNQWDFLKIQGDFGCGGRVNWTIKPFSKVKWRPNNIWK